MLFFFRTNLLNDIFLLVWGNDTFCLTTYNINILGYSQSYCCRIFRIKHDVLFIHFFRQVDFIQFFLLC